MIFTDKPIKAKSVLVRFYRYADTEKGYGDAGTKMFARISLDKFDREEKKRYDGTFYYTYSLKKDFALELLGNYWWIETGYDKTTYSKMEEEKKEAEMMMNMFNNIRQF